MTRVLLLADECYIVPVGRSLIDLLCHPALDLTHNQLPQICIPCISPLSLVLRTVKALDMSISRRDPTTVSENKFTTSLY